MPPQKTSNSGIRTDTSTGTSYIPSSTRPDGSTRKEIRVRPGYRPPEDVELYKNRTAEAFKNRGKDGVPGAEPIEREQVQQKSKNAKRREAARQRAAAGGKTFDSNDYTAEGQADGETDGEANGASREAIANSGSRTPDSASKPAGEEAEREKKARNVKKKLRQARELQGKKESGESLLPEQFAKVLKIQELIRDLEKLGFDEHGEKKSAEAG